MKVTNKRRKEIEKESKSVNSVESTSVEQAIVFTKPEHHWPLSWSNKKVWIPALVWVLVIMLFFV